MITPTAPSLKDCRADFAELVMQFEDQHYSPTLMAHISVFRSPEDQRVVMVTGSVPPDVECPVEEIALEIIETAGIQAGNHLVIGMARPLDGLDQALDAAGGGSATVTMLAQREMSEAEKAVPEHDPVEPITVSLVMGETDFERLTTTSTWWAASYDNSFGRYLENFENTSGGPDKAPSPDWKMAYWVGPEYVNVLLAGAFLRGQHCAYEVLYDLTENPTSQYVILTDFMTASWKQADELRKIRAAAKEESFRALQEG